jgi:hypothetical protein
MDTYKPGEKAPRTGTIQCVKHAEVVKDIKAGETFPPCDNWGDHTGPGNVWKYTS